MKKALALLLAVTLCFSFAGCKKEAANVKRSQELGYEIGDTGGLDLPIGNGEEIRFVGVNSTQSTATYAFDKLSEVTGLTVKNESYPVSSYSEKVKVLLASKNIPEIIGDGISGIYELNDLALQGAFAAVDDHIDNMPNFKKIFGEGSDYNWIFKSYGAGNGKLYGMPSFDVERDVNHGILYRKDIFDKYGIKMWNSPEEFYQVLKTLKEKDPSCTPFTSKNKDGLISALSVSWGIAGYDMYYNEDEKVWKYSDTDPAMKDMLDYLNKLYKEGLIDPEFLTLTQADWTGKMTSNKSYVTYDWIGRLEMFAAQSQVPGYDLRYGNPMGPKQSIKTLSKVQRMFAAVADNKKQELSMKLMDFLYSDAGAELMTLGVKGETYDIDENGNAYYIEFGKGTKVEITDLEEKYGLFMQGTYKRMDKRSCYFNYTEKEQEAQDLANNNDMFEPEDPVLSFSEKEQEEVNNLKEKLVTSFKEFMFNYIIGADTSDAAWDKWVEKSKSLGEEKIVNIYNEAQKRFES